MAVIVTSYGKVAARTLRYPKAQKPGNSLTNPRVLRSTAVNASLEGIERVMAGLRRRHDSKGAQTFQTIVSFSKAELDAADPADHDRAMTLLVGIAEESLPPGTPSAIYLQADGKSGMLHGHIVSCTTLPMDCELNGKTWRAGRKLGGDWTDIDQYRARCNATMERLGFVNELVNTKHHDIRLTKHESGISHRQRDYDKRAQQGTLNPGEQRPLDSARVEYVYRMDDTYMQDSRANSLDGLAEVLADYDSAYNLRVTKDGRISIAFQIPGRKNWTRGTKLGAFMTYDSIVEMLEQNRLGLPRRRLQPRQSETRPDKVMAAPSADEIAQAQAAMLAIANAERAQQRDDAIQAWLWDRAGQEPESTAESLWQQYGDAQLDDDDWAQLHEQMDAWKAKQEAHKAALPQRIAADEAARRARLSPQERRVDQIALDLGLPHDDHVWDELMATIERLDPGMLADDELSTDDWVDAHLDDVELNAIRRRAGLPEVAERPVSGSAVVGQDVQLESAENGAGTPESATSGQQNYSPDDAKPILDPEVGRKWVESGREMGAPDESENSDSLVNEETGSRSDSTGTATPDVGPILPNLDPILATSGSRSGAELPPAGTASDDEAELELLELRHQLATQGESWTDDEYIQALLRMGALRDELGIPEDAPEPSTDAVIAEYERRGLGRTKPDQHEPELASAHAAPSPSSDAHALDDAGVLDDSPADAHAVAGSGRASAHAAPTPYKSKLWTLAEDTEDAEERARIEGYARFDEGAREVLAGGGRIPNSDVPEKLRLRFLRVHGDKFDPLVKEELLLRDAALTARSKEYQTGKRHWDALQALGDREQLDKIDRQTHDGYTALLKESNARRKLMEQRLSLGIYEEDATWEPGQPIPSRQEARDRAKRRAEQRRERTMAAVEGASTDHALDTDRDRDKPAG